MEACRAEWSFRSFSVYVTNHYSSCKLKMNLFNNFKQKSPQQRFLFVLGLVFLGLYVFLALTLFIWKSMPVDISYNRRVILGVLLLVYAVFRFSRLLNAESNR
jgi:hypothetical protein